jgi:hypothetical protein
MTYDACFGPEVIALLLGLYGMSCTVLVDKRKPLTPIYDSEGKSFLKKICEQGIFIG